MGGIEDQLKKFVDKNGSGENKLDGMAAADKPEPVKAVNPTKEPSERGSREATRGRRTRDRGTNRNRSSDSRERKSNGPPVLEEPLHGTFHVAGTLDNIYSNAKNLQEDIYAQGKRPQDIAEWRELVRIYDEFEDRLEEYSKLPASQAEREPNIRAAIEGNIASLAALEETIRNRLETASSSAGKEKNDRRVGGPHASKTRAKAMRSYREAIRMLAMDATEAEQAALTARKEAIKSYGHALRTLARESLEGADDRARDDASELDVAPVKNVPEPVVEPASNEADILESSFEGWDPKTFTRYQEAKNMTPEEVRQALRGIVKASPYVDADIASIDMDPAVLARASKYQKIKLDPAKQDKLDARAESALNDYGKAMATLAEEGTKEGDSASGKKNKVKDVDVLLGQLDIQQKRYHQALEEYYQGQGIMDQFLESSVRGQKLPEHIEKMRLESIGAMNALAQATLGTIAERKPGRTQEQLAALQARYERRYKLDENALVIQPEAAELAARTRGIEARHPRLFGQLYTRYQQLPPGVRIFGTSAVMFGAGAAATLATGGAALVGPAALVLGTTGALARWRAEVTKNPSAKAGLKILASLTGVGGWIGLGASKAMKGIDRLTGQAGRAEATLAARGVLVGANAVALRREGRREARGSLDAMQRRQAAVGTLASIAGGYALGSTVRGDLDDLLQRVGHDLGVPGVSAPVEAPQTVSASAGEQSQTSVGSAAGEGTNPGGAPSGGSPDAASAGNAEGAPVAVPEGTDDMQQVTEEIREYEAASAPPVEYAARPGDGGIKLIEGLQDQMEEKGITADTPGLSQQMKDVLEADTYPEAEALAKKYGLYQPDAVADSASIPQGAKVSFVEGKLTLTAGETSIAIDETTPYNGGMFDTNPPPPVRTTTTESAPTPESRVEAPLVPREEPPREAGGKSYWEMSENEKTAYWNRQSIENAADVRKDWERYAREYEAYVEATRGEQSAEVAASAQTVESAPAARAETTTNETPPRATPAPAPADLPPGGEPRSGTTAVEATPRVEATSQPAPQAAPVEAAPIPAASGESSVAEVRSSPAWDVVKEFQATDLFTTIEAPGTVATEMRSDLFDVMRESGVGPVQGESLEQYVARANAAIERAEATGVPIAPTRIYESGGVRFASGGDSSAQQMLAYEYTRLNPGTTVLVRVGDATIVYPATRVPVETPDGKPKYNIERTDAEIPTGPSRAIF